MINAAVSEASMHSFFHEKLVRQLQMYIAPIKVRFGALVMFLSLLRVVEEGFPVGTDIIQFN
jgi:hypothetical protein